MSSNGCGGSSELFAVVGYLPEPLAGFIDRLRREVSPACRLRAHITVVHPRPLAGSPGPTGDEIDAAIAGFHSFKIDVDRVQVFAASHVVYLSIGHGHEQLRELNARLKQRLGPSSEPWNFEPHVTVAQEPDPAAVERARGLAAHRWQDYKGPRSFTLERLTLVKGSVEHGWADLAAWELASPVLA